ncbi:hypothetical protein J7T55_002744 [Diaporthe amygdali]|uniref:uncharacterized protein n=1 Tax=Phomopsis amygdali TaxID=1214568 RepID=UPI0022FF375B|nr:uncharacterized protein J7T55_002744 [Diaporthe amygdali]KAJ0122232.1 hypothetical protein J7T55_002744 [Diaporthe amygdali]
MIDHEDEEEPAQVSRGVMPLSVVKELRPGLTPAVVTPASSSSSSGSRKSLRGSRQRLGHHQQEPIIPKGGVPGPTRQPAILLGYTQKAPANLEIDEMDLAAIPSPAS